MEKIEGLKLIISIVERKKGKKIVKLFEKKGCFYQHILLGKGTAPKEIFAYLGLGDIEKDVVLSVVEASIAPSLLEELQIKMHFNEPGNGVACSIPISSIDGTSALKTVLGMEV